MAGPMTTSTVRSAVPKKTSQKKVAPQVTPTPPVAAENPAPTAATPTLGYRSKRVPLYHPYQNITIPIAHGVPLVKDSWVEVQLAAKVIEEVKI